MYLQVVIERVQMLNIWLGIIVTVDSPLAHVFLGTTHEALKERYMQLPYIKRKKPTSANSAEQQPSIRDCFLDDP